jgi:soluble lytic murein transglycosylase-like protein
VVLENIPYEDTAGYVKRVMKNTEKYKNIYDIK